jgi:hypothetical protein
MSDQSQGPDWWLASDGKWYPPQSHSHAPLIAKARTGGEKLLLGGCAGMVVGAFLPWATVGPFDIAGTDGDGVLTLFLAVVVGALAWVRKAPRFALVLLGLAVLIAIYDLADISEVAGAEQGLFDVTIGIGLLLTIAANIVAVVGWVKHRRRHDDEPSDNGR